MSVQMRRGAPPTVVPEPQPVCSKILVKFKDAAGKEKYEADVSKYFGDMEIVSQDDIEVELQVQGSVVDADNLCGSVTGDVLSPLQSPLDGSTFAAIRLDDDGSDLGTLPTEFPTKCE